MYRQHVKTKRWLYSETNTTKSTATISFAMAVASQWWHGRSTELASRHWAVVFNKIKLERRPEIEMGEDWQTIVSSSRCLLTHYAKVGRREMFTKSPDHNFVMGFIAEIYIFRILCSVRKTYDTDLRCRLPSRLPDPFRRSSCRRSLEGDWCRFVSGSSLRRHNWRCTVPSPTSPCSLRPQLEEKIRTGVGKHNLTVEYHFISPSTPKLK